MKLSRADTQKLIHIMKSRINFLRNKGLTHEALYTEELEHKIVNLMERNYE